MKPGKHHGIIYAMYDLGWIEEEYEGEKGMKPKMILQFEFPDEEFTGEHGTHKVTKSKKITKSLHEKATLRKWLENINGNKLGYSEMGKLEDKNFAQLIGMNCMVEIKTFTPDNEEIAYIANLEKWTGDKKEPEHKIFTWNFQEEGVPEYAADWIKELIAEGQKNHRPKAEDSAQAPSTKEEIQDEIPF